MNRRSWFFLMMFGALLTGASAYLIATRLEVREQMVEVPLQEATSQPVVAPEPVAPSSFTATETPSTDISSVSAVAPAEAAKSTGTAAADEGWVSTSGDAAKRNILFTYQASSAKEVFIIGDFNNWFREPMKKNAKGNWRATIKLSPGTYEYMFVVDGKRTRDSKGKRSPDGTKSVVVVKPLAKK